VYLSLNVSPATITSGELEPVLNGAAIDRIVLEITEHTFIQEYPNVERAPRPLRERGLRLAVDDAGAGYASFRHILKLAPNMIKLDVSLVHDIDIDPAERALASAMIRFAGETRSTIVCEGVETLAELNTLRELGVTRMQGFLAGRPMPLEQAVSLCSPGAGLLTI
jgi:EAL domain-containing protein (putative c-di-GMP-specific phosphodiesterase class I)